MVDKILKNLYYRYQPIFKGGLSMSNIDLVFVEATRVRPAHRAELRYKGRCVWTFYSHQGVKDFVGGSPLITNHLPKEMLRELTPVCKQGLLNLAFEFVTSREIATRFARERTVHDVVDIMILDVARHYHAAGGEMQIQLCIPMKVGGVHDTGKTLAYDKTRRALKFAEMHGDQVNPIGPLMYSQRMVRFMAFITVEQENLAKLALQEFPRIHLDLLLATFGKEMPETNTALDWLTLNELTDFAGDFDVRGAFKAYAGEV
jgi:hypothetical protein